MRLPERQPKKGRESMTVTTVVYPVPGIDYIPSGNEMIQRGDAIANIEVQEVHGADSVVLGTMPPIEELEARILLGVLADGRLRVLTPFEVQFTVEGSHHIAEAISINEFGFGESRAEAVLDLRRAITALYFALKANQSRLGPDLREAWAKLREAVAERV